MTPIGDGPYRQPAASPNQRGGGYLPSSRRLLGQQGDLEMRARFDARQHQAFARLAEDVNFGIGLFLPSADGKVAGNLEWLGFHSVPDQQADGQCRANRGDDFRQVLGVGPSEREHRGIPC